MPLKRGSRQETGAAALLAKSPESQIRNNLAIALNHYLESDERMPALNTAFKLAKETEVPNTLRAEVFADAAIIFCDKDRIISRACDFDWPDQMILKAAVDNNWTPVEFDAAARKAGWDDERIKNLWARYGANLLGVRPPTQDADGSQGKEQIHCQVKRLSTI